MAWPIRRYFRLLWWTLCLLTFLALPLTIWEFQKQEYDVHYQAWFIGGIFVILTMPISIYEIALHTEYYTQPRLQKHVIRILWMVPIYAVNAWFALRFRKAREYLDPIRECYEAFVIYSFFAYLMAFLQDTLGDLDEYMAKKPAHQHMFGLACVLRPWDMTTRFLWECKKGVLNYVILRPVCTGLAFITDIFDKYGEGQINFKKSYVYLATVTNFSQLWALYCLLMLYTAMHEELRPIRPLSKFICIKAVVFVTFWQGIGIAILVYAGVIRRESWTTYDKMNVASGIQDFLICIEMFLAALAHAYAFPPRDYMGGGASKGFFTNVRYMFDLRDVVDDVGLVVEEHVSSATSAVVKVPQRAVKKAMKNTKKLLGVGQGGSQRARMLEEEEEAAAKCSLLGGGPGSSGAPGGGGAPGSAATSVNGEHELLSPPQLHEMRDFDSPPHTTHTSPGGPGGPLGGGVGIGHVAASSAYGTSGSLPLQLRGGGGGAGGLTAFGSMPPLGSGGAVTLTTAGGGGGLTGLLQSALGPARGGAGGRRRGSVGEYGMRDYGGGGADREEYDDLEAGGGGGGGGSMGGFGGVEVPLVAVSHHRRSGSGSGAGTPTAEGPLGRGGGGGGGGGGSGSGSGRQKRAASAGAVAAAVAASAGRANSGGGGLGEDAAAGVAYERLPMLPPVPRRTHNE